MQALESTPAWQSKEEADDDLLELPCKKVTSAAALPDIADLDNENHIQTADKAVAVSSAVKSYAAVTKASVLSSIAAMLGSSCEVRRGGEEACQNKCGQDGGARQ